MKNLTYFLYKDINNWWRSVVDENLVPENTKFREVKREDLLQNFNSVDDFIEKANDYCEHKSVTKFIFNSNLVDLV